MCWSSNREDLTLPCPLTGLAKIRRSGNKYKWWLPIYMDPLIKPISFQLSSILTEFSRCESQRFPLLSAHCWSPGSDINPKTGRCEAVDSPIWRAYTGQNSVIRYCQPPAVGIHNAVIWWQCPFMFNKQKCWRSSYSSYPVSGQLLS